MIKCQTRININSDKLDKILTEVVFRGLRLNIPLTQIGEETASILKETKFDSFDVKAIGYENYEELRKCIKTDSEVISFNQKLRSKFAILSDIIGSSHPLKSDDQNKLKTKLLQQSKVYITSDELKNVLIAIGMFSNKILMRLVADSFICEDNLLKKLKVEKLVESLSGLVIPQILNEETPTEQEIIYAQTQGKNNKLVS
jgi:hypothetical protein